MAFSEDPEYGQSCGFILCNPEIYRVDRNGLNLARLTNHPVFWDEAPTWSPSGDRIAFDASYGPHEASELYSVRPDGSGLIQLTHSKIWGHAMWKPNTDMVSYLDNVGCSGGDGTCTIELFVVQADGGTPRRLTSNSMDISTVGGFAWSPDGAHVAYESLRDGRDGLYVSDGSGANELLLYKNPFDGSIGSLSWSPDGQYVTFLLSRYDGGSDQIWVVSASGSHTTLVFEEGIIAGPVWSRIP